MVVRYYREEGYEDPTGNNWESEESWRSATDLLLKEAFDGVHSNTDNYDIMDAYDQSLAFSLRMQKARGGSRGGTGTKIAQWNATTNSGGDRSEGAIFSYALWGGDPSFTAGLGEGGLSSGEMSQVMALADRWWEEYASPIIENEIWGALGDLENQEEFVGLSDASIRSSLIDPERLATGDFGIELRDISTPQLYVIARGLQEESRRVRPKDTPALIKSIGKELVRRINFLYGNAALSETTLTVIFQPSFNKDFAKT